MTTIHYRGTLADPACREALVSHLTAYAANANLGQRIRELISTSREMRALVGFFYFSGVKVLYEALRAKSLKENAAQ